MPIGALPLSGGLVLIRLVTTKRKGNEMETKLCKDLFLGRTKTGERYYLSIELRERTYGVSVNHQDLKHFQELAFTGVLVRKYGSISPERAWDTCGQNYEDMLKIIEPAKGFTRLDIKRIYELWQEWHLNTMQTHCSHQDKATKWDECEPCPITGYRAGSAWLVRELPESVIQEINALLGKVLVAA